MPRLKRYDETTPDGEVVESMYIRNPYFEDQTNRLNSLVASIGRHHGLVATEQQPDVQAVIAADSLGTAISEEETAKQVVQ